MADDTILMTRVIDAVTRIQAFPYAWPTDPTAASARASGVGSCASKHALLAEDLDELGVPSLPLLMVGPLVPRALAGHPSVADGVGLVEVHECVTVVTPWSGPGRVDVTWDPPLIRAGLAGTLGWDGASDMVVAVETDQPGWAVPRAGLRAAKEALRTRIYGPGERDRRDRTLAALAQLFDGYRDADPAGTA